MIRKPKITSLAELKTRQKQVRMESNVAQRELAHTMGTTRENLGEVLLKKVAIPVGGGLLGIIVLSKLFSSDNSKRPVINETRVIHEYPDGKRRRGKSKFAMLKRLPALFGVIRVLAPIIQAIIGAVNTHKAKEAAQTAKSAARRS